MPVDDAPAAHVLRPFVVLAFGSTHASLAAETVLVAAGFTVRVMPLPRHRGNQCGIALRLPPAEEHAALEELAKHDLTVSARDEIEDL